MSRRRGRWKSKPFHYENMWKSHGDYMEFVTKTWDPGSGDLDLSAASTALMSGSMVHWKMRTHLAY